MGYAERVQRYRLHRKMSQEQLAKQTGLSMTAISKIEHGDRKLTFDEAVRFAQVLRVDLADLAGVHPLKPPSAEVDAVVARSAATLLRVFQDLESVHA